MADDAAIGLEVENVGPVNQGVDDENRRLVLPFVRFVVTQCEFVFGVDNLTLGVTNLGGNEFDELFGTYVGFFDCLGHQLPGSALGVDAGSQLIRVHSDHLAGVTDTAHARRAGESN
jgi:hypothetical protein